MKAVRLKRIKKGWYETHDGKFDVVHWDVTAGNRVSWAISDRDEKTGQFEFLCEVETLGDARRYLAGEHVFILS